MIAGRELVWQSALHGPEMSRIEELGSADEHLRKPLELCARLGIFLSEVQATCCFEALRPPRNFPQPLPRRPHAQFRVDRAHNKDAKAAIANTRVELQDVLHNLVGRPIMRVPRRPIRADLHRRRE